LIVEKYRESGKIKTRTIANLSKFPKEAVMAIEAAFRNKKDVMVPLKDISIKQSVDYGFVFALLSIMERLRIKEAFEKILQDPYRVNIAMLMIIGKIVTRGSKLCIFNWIKRNDIIAKKIGIETSTLKLDTLYDVLGDLSNLQEKIENKWNIYHKTGKDEVFLYDITSSYFEGVNNALAAFGHNRDGKKGKLQIVVGLLTGSDGFPLSTKVFEGNENDHKTVISQLRKIKNDFGVDNIIFVGDRGMRIRYNLAQMDEQESKGIEYITALSLEEIRCLLNEGDLQLNLFSKELAEVEVDGVRYILCNNPDLEQEHSDTRASLKAKFEDTLYDIKLSYDARQQKNNNNKIRLAQGNSNKNLVTQFSEKQIDSYKYRVRKALEKYHVQSFYEVSITQENFKVEFKFEKYTQAKQLDGKYVIVSNVPKERMTKETIRQEYKNLQNVEHAFRDMKTTQLDIRPIFHINEDTTRGHVFITMFAYAIIKEFENAIFHWLKQYNKNKNTQLSLIDVEEELKMVKLNVLKIDKRHEQILITDLSDLQKEIFNVLKINRDSLIL
jgi:transposase